MGNNHSLNVSAHLTNIHLTCVDNNSYYAWSCKGHKIPFNLVYQSLKLVNVWYPRFCLIICLNKVPVVLCAGKYLLFVYGSLILLH